MSSIYPAFLVFICTGFSGLRESTQDTSILQGFQDEIDGVVYAEAVRIFSQNLALHNVSQESCQPCFAQAGLYDS